MKENLTPPLPAPYVEMGYKVLGGMVEYLGTTVPEIFGSVEDEQLQADLDWSQLRWIWKRIWKPLPPPG